MTQLPRTVTDRVRRYLKVLRAQSETRDLFRILNENGEAFLFGGAVRDVVFGNRGNVSDLDIVVSGAIDSNSLEARFGRFRRTKLGGLRGMIGGYEVDVWELRDSATLASYPRSEVDLSRLLKNVCFSTDAVAASTSRFRVISDSAFRSSYWDKIIDFVVTPPPLDIKVVARISRLVVKHRLGMSVSVASYFVEGMEHFGRDKILAADYAWGKNAVLNEIRLEGVRAELSFAIDRAYLLATKH